MIDSDQFCGVLADYFTMDPASLDTATRLELDAGFDSLMILECVLMLEELAGRQLHDDAIASIVTVGDLYGFYAQEEARIHP